MAKKISSLPVGAKVRDVKTKYYGVPIGWQIGDKNHRGYPANSTTLVSENILKICCFDASERGGNSDRVNYGNNRYALCNLRQWLNKAGAGWYTAQHDNDNPPSNANVWSNYNEYDSQAGFLTGFGPEMRAALMTTTLVVAKSSTDGGGSETVQDKVFLLSMAEVGLGAENGISEGSVLALFNSNSSRERKPTAQAVSHSKYTHTNLRPSRSWYYCLRSPCSSLSDYVYFVDSDGSRGGEFAYNSRYGILPAINLPLDTLVSDSPDSQGYYTIIWNNAPTTPPSITVPTTVRGGERLTVSWESSSDPDNNLSGYILERQYNNGVWTRLYKGIDRSYTDTITKGWQSVAYRVKAYDSADAQSEYRTSQTRTVINNTPPTISGSDANLGTKTGAFAQSYTVTDSDSGQTLTVVEKIDETQKRSYTATSGQSYSFNVTAEEWLGLRNGSHTLTITASDNYGGTATRTYTFAKSQTEIELTLAKPLAADGMIEKAIMNVTRQIPAKALFTVEVCNNGNDASPTWEDVTQAVVSGNKFFLTNKTKTASDWGFNFRIKVNRNGAVGDCYIASAGGNFE